MKRAATALLLPILFAVASMAARAQLDFFDFSGINGLKLTGSATATVNSIRLTPSAANKVGALWFRNRQLVRDGFMTSFTFKLSNPGGNNDGSSNGGDGLAFVIQNASDSALGAAGGSIGYDGIPKSLAVEFDTWNDGFRVNGDPNGNHVSIHTRGVQPNSSDHGYSLAATTATPYLKDGQPHRAVIQYRNKLLSIFVDDCSRPVLETIINLDSALKLDSGRAWLGFTAATASAWETHELLSWTSASYGITAGDSITVCEGDSARLTVATVNGSVLWSTGARTPSIKVGTSGLYSATVTERLGCVPVTYTKQIKVSILTLPDPTITYNGSLVLCEGDSITLDAGGNYDSYRWTNGATSRRLRVKSAGDYGVTVGNGICTRTSKTLTVVVMPSPKPVITPLGSVNLCQGDSVTLDAGDGYAIYKWSTGADTRFIRVGDSAVYTLEVYGANGCRGVASPLEVKVYRMPRPSIVPHGRTTLCEGDTLVLDASIGYDRYSWSTGQTGQSIVVRKSGSYVVTVTSAEGCVGVAPPLEVTFIPPPAPVITPSGPTSFCTGGSVTLNAPAGYRSYLWSSGEISQSITVNAPGTFEVTVTDTNGCTGGSEPIEVKVGSEITPVIAAAGAVEFCEGDSVVIAAQRGYASYRWSNGATTDTIVVKSSGSYSVQVTDAGGCGGSSSPVIVTVHPAPAVPVISGAGGSLVSTAATSYEWFLNGAPIAGEISQSIVPSTEGSYSVEIASPDGCRARSAPYIYTLSASSVTLGVIEGAPGERVRLPIVLDSSRNLDPAGALAFRATLRFRASLLVPVDATLTSAIQGNDRILTVEGQRTPGLAKGTLKEVELMVTLGDTTETPVHLETFAWTDGNAPAAIADGIFHLTGLCVTDAARLIALGSGAALKGVHPNPAGTSAVVEFATIESGRTRLYLSDALGRRVMTIADGALPTGAQSATIDVTELPAGIYLLTLETPTMRETRRVEVVR